MAGKRKKKQITLTEFRAWLEGVEELQPTSWHPDGPQWKLIRNKIDCIIENKIQPPVPQPMQPVSRMVPANVPPMQPAPIPTESALPIEPEALEMTPAAKAALAGKPIVPTVMTPGADGKLHTPNIDTSDGDYNSGFE